MALIGAVAQTYTFYDSKQQVARLRLYLGGDGAAGTGNSNGTQLGVDLAALSNSSAVAGAIRGNGPYTNNPAPVSQGTAATYEDVADKGVFVFQDSAGGLHRYQVACPKSSIFIADQETIDFTNAAVKQFVADMTNSTFGGTVSLVTLPVVTRTVSPLVSAVGGYRKRGTTPRKFSIFTRNPLLTGQGE